MNHVEIRIDVFLKKGEVSAAWAPVLIFQQVFVSIKQIFDLSFENTFKNQLHFLA